MFFFSSAISVTHLSLDELTERLLANEFIEYDQRWGVVGSTEWIEIKYKHALGKARIKAYYEEDDLLLIKFSRKLKALGEEILGGSDENAL